MLGLLKDHGRLTKMRFLFLLILLFLPLTVQAQTIDYCKMIPSPNTDSEMILRLRCTIQILDNKLMLESDRAVDAEVRANLAEAKLNTLLQQQTKEKEKHSKPSKK